MRRHPGVLARYVRERVPPQIVQGLFSRNPIEPDDLAVFLEAIQTSVREEPQACGPAVVADYLRQLLQTRSADTQFAMLSSSEQQVLRELLDTIPSGEGTLKASFMNLS